MHSSESCQFGIKALIPYDSNSTDKKNRKVGPFDYQDVSSLYYRHWLGTDALGRDVLAGLIEGSYIAFIVGILSSLFALIIGVFFAYWSGFVGDTRFKLLPSLMALFALVLLAAIFYAWYSTGWMRIVWLIIPIICLAAFRQYSKRQSNEKNQISLPFDILIIRLIEIFRSIPNLFLVLILLTLFNSSGYWNVIFIIALIRWPVITRHLRAEILNIKEENYIHSARSIGLSDPKIFKKYILPLTVSPIIIATAFGFSSAILLESTLSFLGIGVPLDQVSWGSILREARHDIGSWWLAIFPGILIYLMIYLFNDLGDKINQQLLNSVE